MADDCGKQWHYFGTLVGVAVRILFGQGRADHIQVGLRLIEANARFQSRNCAKKNVTPLFGQRATAALRSFPKWRDRRRREAIT